MEVLGFNISLTAFLLTVLLIFLAYKYLTWGSGFWKSRGIQGPRSYPVLGTMYTFFKKTPIQLGRDDLAKYGKVHGEYVGKYPILVIADPTILREIMVKEFHNFTDRGEFGREMSEHQFAIRKFLTILTGEEWKRVRNTLTPAFSASKMKAMTRQINQCVDILMENLKNGQNEQTEIKKFTDGFTFDVIARVGFGVELDSQKDPNNPFIKNGRKIFDAGLTLKGFLMLILFMVPWIYKPLAARFPRFVSTNADITDFFLELIRKIIKQREEGGYQEHNLDMIQLMLNAHKLEQTSDEVDSEIAEGVSKDLPSRKGLTEEEVLGQSFLIFLAGFETTSNTIAFLLYNLALNPECQEKARAEVDEVVRDKRDITYEMTYQLPYLEMCINESLRLSPPATRTDRHCVADTTINGLTIPKGVTINISIAALHYDPDVWSEPEKFIPERFTPEAKAARDAFSYMPFGMGPRNCIGMRLAQMEIRIAVAKILQNFNIKTCEKTEIPLQFAVGAFVKAKNGVFLRLEPRHVE